MLFVSDLVSAVKVYESILRRAVQSSGGKSTTDSDHVDGNSEDESLPGNSSDRRSEDDER